MLIAPSSCVCVCVCVDGVHASFPLSSSHRQRRWKAVLEKLKYFRKSILFINRYRCSGQFGECAEYSSSKPCRAFVLR
uniref:Putative secreted protein n=1 Tax=Anopheles darlingi TaxID=43151 RepID=A0A2M4D3K0_ANODA